MINSINSCKLLNVLTVSISGFGYKKIIQIKHNSKLKPGLTSETTGFKLLSEVVRCISAP